MAYKLLARNQIIPDTLRLAVEGKRPLGPFPRPGKNLSQSENIVNCPGQQKPLLCKWVGVLAFGKIETLALGSGLCGKDVLLFA